MRREAMDEAHDPVDQYLRDLESSTEPISEAAVADQTRAFGRAHPDLADDPRLVAMTVGFSLSAGSENNAAGLLASRFGPMMSWKNQEGGEGQRPGRVSHQQIRACALRILGLVARPERDSSHGRPVPSFLSSPLLDEPDGGRLVRAALANTKAHGFRTGGPGARRRVGRGAASVDGGAG